MTSPTRPTPAHDLPGSWLAAWHPDHLRDAAERAVLFMDALRRRGNVYLEHVADGEPPLLKFEHDVVLDGRTLPQRCNYVLMQIRPPADAPAPQAAARPVVVVDPRAGHGPGIGGFKDDSEVGVALRAGHPVYFVGFRPEPEDGQTLADVLDAEAVFLQTVAARHPQAPLPLVVGNCQAGWAMAMVAAVHPQRCGPLMLVGSPLSYWAGSSTLNPMRYAGATLGGSWLASLSADLGGDRFDGAHLVDNFERLNPANTLWSKYHRLWEQVDTESERFLEFERWWGGFFRMTGAEIEAIVENLFVGNRLARGEVVLGPHRIDLRRIRQPVIVFASHGDNITPPPQALNWIIDTWGSERAIAAAGRVIVYVLHESVGHLGIFVGADVARKQHDQIVNSLDVVDNLPPGLYEMRVQAKDGGDEPRWSDLEPGSYTVSFEHRTMDDLRALNPEGRDEEAQFAAVARLSALSADLYKACVRPWLRAWPLRAWGDWIGECHPLRLQRRLWNDHHPAAAWVAAGAERVRAQRHALPDDHPSRRWLQDHGRALEDGLNRWRDARDQAVVQWTRWVFGPLGLGALWSPPASDEAVAVQRAHDEIEALRAQVLPRLAEGGAAQAVCRIVLAGMKSLGFFERRSLRLATLLAQLDGSHGVPWRELMRNEALIEAVAPVEALNAIGTMLPQTEQREHALALAAAVLMIEPTLGNPRSEIIELLIGLFELDPARVMDRACRLTAPLAQAAPAAALARVPRRPRGVRGASPARPTRRSHAPRQGAAS